MVRLRELRKSKKLSMKAFGEIFNLSESTISLYENGKHDPDIETIIQFANYFNVSIDYLVGRTDDPSMASDAIVETADGRIVPLNDAEFSPEELSRITTVVESVVKKYLSAPEEVKEDEPSVLAAHADGHTPEEIQADLKLIKKYIKDDKERKP